MSLCHSDDDDDDNDDDDDDDDDDDYDDDVDDPWIQKVVTLTVGSCVICLFLTSVYEYNEKFKKALLSSGMDHTVKLQEL